MNIKEPLAILMEHVLRAQAESPEVTGLWYAKLGRTICIQPGQLDEFIYVTIDLSTMKLDRIRDTKLNRVKREK
jgi:hypothetical protein